MSKYLFLLILLCAVILSRAQQKQKKLLFVIADGIPTDVLKKVKTPFLNAIVKKGAFLSAYVGGEKGAYSQTPTISAVGYNSLLTGTWVNKHNVWDNDIAAPNYSYYTIFRFFKDQYPQKKTAIFSTWLDNRTKLVGDHLPQTGNIKIDYYFDGLEKDTVQYPHDKDALYIHYIDEAVTNHADSFIRKEGPDLSWVYLEYTDDMGHRYGDSPQFYSAIEMMDAQIGRLWNAIQYRQKKFNEEWRIYITTDHGRTANGKGHGGQSDRERNTWIITNEKKINPFFKKNAPGIVDIMPAVADYLNIIIPRESAMEIDGMSLTGKVPAYALTAELTPEILRITWKAMGNNGTAKIWLSVSNSFKSGGRDDYRLLKEVSISDEKLEIEKADVPDSDFYKVVLESNGFFLNRWILR